MSAVSGLHVPRTAIITDEDVLRAYPQVRVDHVNKEFYRGLLERRLVAGRCADCRMWHTPLRPLCPSCWSTAVGAEAVSGRGTVHLLTVLHQGPPGVDYPWPLAAVELAEQPGLRVTATLVDTPPPLRRIGQPVALTWIERDGAPWPAFRALTPTEARA